MRRRPALWIRAVLRAAVAVLLASSAAVAGRGAEKARPTRADLEGERRRAAALESELALASTRKPYLVLDLDSRMLRYRLMGMTMREVPLPDVRVTGLLPASPEAPRDAPSLAGIFTLAEKEGDPRLNPLTPEQVEAGDDDENAANVLPPEPPKAYRLNFKQSVEVQVEAEAHGGAHGLQRVSRSIWERLGGGSDAKSSRLAVSIRLEQGPAAEVYRSLIPSLRFLVIPPKGFVLPAAGQEPPPKPKAARPAPAKPPKPIEPPGVPFQIPAPVDESGNPREGSPTEQPAAEPPPAAPAPPEHPASQPPPSDAPRIP